MMNTVEIWTNHPNGPSQMVEKWKLQPDGRAALTFCKDLSGVPMYDFIGGATPDDGESFLKGLVHVINNSSYMLAKPS